MPSLRCQIIRWLSTDPFPGWVEAQVVDANGREWLFHDKPPVFGEQLAFDDALPVEATIACEVIAGDSASRTVTVDTSVPDGVEATDGTTRFVVLADQLVSLDRSASGPAGIASIRDAAID